MILKSVKEMTLKEKIGQLILPGFHCTYYDDQIKTLIEENSNAEGWLLASSIGTHLQNKFPDFDCRNYGHKRTIDLLEDLGFEIKVSKDNFTYFVRNKN